MGAPLPERNPDRAFGRHGDLVGSAILVAVGVIAIVVRRELALAFAQEPNLGDGFAAVTSHIWVSLLFTGLATASILVGLAKFVVAVERRRLAGREEAGG